MLQELESGPARVMVVDVLPGGPALEAGLRQGDRILEVGGEATPTIASLVSRLGRCGPGAPLEVLVRRGGRDLEFSIVPRERPDDPDPPAGTGAREESGFDREAATGDLPGMFVPDDVEDCGACELEGEEGDAIPRELIQPAPRVWLGVSLLEMTPELRVHFGAPAEQGVLIGQVRAGGPADEAGLRVGDLLVSVDDDAVRGPREVSELLAGREPGEKIQAAVIRDRRRLAVPIVLGRRPASDLEGMHGSEQLLGELYRLPPGRFLFDSERLTAGSRHEDLARRIEQLRERLEELERRLEAPPRN